MSIPILIQDISPGGRKTFITNLMAELPEFGFFTITGKPKRGFYPLVLLKYYLSSVRALQRERHSIQAILGIGISSLGGFLYAKLHGIPRILNLSDSNYVNHKKMLTKKPGLRMLFGLFFVYVIERLLFSLASVIVLPSKTGAQELQAVYKAKKIRVIPEWPRMIKPSVKGRAQFGIRPGEKVIVFPRASERKGIGLFVASLAMVTFKNPVRIVILGMKEEIESSHWNILSRFNVTFTGEISEPDKIRLFQLADVMVYVPTSEQHSYTVLEAQSVGLSIVAVKLQWLLQTLGKTGIFIERKKEALAHALELIATEKRRKNILPRNSRAVFERMIREYQTLFREVAQ